MIDLEDARRQLEARLEILEARTQRIEADLSRPRPRDSEDRATERQNDPVLERLESSEIAEISQIHSALGRIDAGSYGRCASCDEEIGEGRLRVAPVAIHCVACAESQ